MRRILIAYATTHGHTRNIAYALEDRLRAHDVRVTVADLRAGQEPPPLVDFDAAILGSHVRFDRHARALRAYITAHRAELGRMPCFLFSVSLSAAGQPRTADPNGYVARLCEELAWWPREAAVFGGALLYRSYNPLLRWLLQRIAARHGRPVDTSRDHVLTDWDEVNAFADTAASAVLGQRLAPRSA